MKPSTDRLHKQYLCVVCACACACVCKHQPYNNNAAVVPRRN